LYTPLVLKAGESAYIDSSMGHAYIVKGKAPCRLLAVCSASERDLRAAMEAGVIPFAASKRAVVAPKPKRTRRR